MFGSAKATQEADNILVLQEHANDNETKSRYLEVSMLYSNFMDCLALIRRCSHTQILKNRYDGQLGVVRLDNFDKESKRYIIEHPEHSLTDEEEEANSSTATVINSNNCH